MDLSNAGLVFIVTLVTVVGAIVIYYFVWGVMPGASVVAVTDPPISTSGLEENQAKFIFFYTTWCPWSKKAEQPWASLKQIHKNSNKKYGGTTVIFEEVNAESETAKAALYGVKAYPTFKLETSTKVYEMLGKPSASAFKAFLITVLGQEST
jgi:thiol-disulfide isomerase/thioredoxin